MFKRFFFILIIGLFVLAMVKFSYAMMCGDNMQLAQTKEASIQDNPTEMKEAVDVGNKICPVSGEQVDEKMKVTYEYEGKTYNFCCAMCIDEFKKAPEKYIQKVEGELKAQVKEEAKMGTKEEAKTTTEPAMKEGMHKDHHH
mgnify:CR=1 FL=1